MSENETPQEEGLITDAIAELIALGAASVSNSENAFQVHHYRLTQLGVSKEDMVQAVNIALTVKDRSHRAIIDMAQTYLLGKKAGGCGEEGCGCSGESCGEEGGCGEGCGCN